MRFVCCNHFSWFLTRESVYLIVFSHSENLLDYQDKAAANFQDPTLNLEIYTAGTLIPSLRADDLKCQKRENVERFEVLVVWTHLARATAARRLSTGDWNVHLTCFLPGRTSFTHTLDALTKHTLIPGEIQNTGRFLSTREAPRGKHHDKSPTYEVNPSDETLLFFFFFFYLHFLASMVMTRKVHSFIQLVHTGALL